MKFTVVIIAQGVFIWLALAIMNETEDGKFPDIKKLVGAMCCTSLTSYIVNHIGMLVDYEKYPLVKTLYFSLC